MLQEVKEDPKITRMIVLGPSAKISQAELVQKLHMMELPLVIKSTCYGAILHGEENLIMDAIDQVRKLDPNNIFIKDRGFPPGDPRRCRGHRGAAREGYHQLEREFRLLEYVGEALRRPQKVKVEKPEKVSPDVFKEIIEKEDKKKDTKKD